MKNKEKTNVQTTVAQNTKSKPTTTQSDFDFVSKMENYDFSTLYAEYKYDKICQDNKRMYGLDDPDVGLPTFEMALQTFAVDFPDKLKEDAIKTYFYKLPKCGFFMFDEACFAAIPEFAKSKFMDIYINFRKHQIKTNNEGILIDVKVWNRTVELLSGTGKEMTDPEFGKIMLCGAIKRDKELGPKFLAEAINAYFYQGAHFGTLGLFDGTPQERREFKTIILLTFIFQNPARIDAMYELLILREEIQKKLNLSPNEYVGF